MINQHRVLICPLNWGLGHATRMIPIINQLIEQKAEIIIAADGEALDYLRTEYPELKSVCFPQYKVSYSSRKTQIFSIIKIIPSIIYYTIKEHFVLKELIKYEKIDCIISDNRYGLWNKSIYSVFVTHQLRVLFPGKLFILEPLFQKLVKATVNNYDECWIPDFSDKNNLSGRLSHPNNLKNQIYIGPLSRYNKLSGNCEIKKKYDFALILSGPEPQRSILEQIIYNQLSIKGYKAVIVRGAYLEVKLPPTPNIDVFERLDSKDLLKIIESSDFIICRSGYSSIMDLVTLNKTAVLVPTPGQTEQEYLAQYLYDKKLFYYIPQTEFCIDKAINSKIEFPVNEFSVDNSAFMQTISDLSSRVNNIKHQKSNK